MGDRLLTAVQAKHTARVFLSEARARRHGLGATGSRSTPLSARVCAPPPRPTAGAAARTGTAGPTGSVRMSALAFPLSLKLPQHSRQAAIAGNRSIMPGLPRLSRVEPFHRPRPKHQVCRFQNYLVASIPLPIREPRAEHHEQSCARLQKLLRRIPLQMLTVVNLPSQCIQQIGERPVSARSHGARICCLSPQFPLPPCRLATWPRTSPDTTPSSRGPLAGAPRSAPPLGSVLLLSRHVFSPPHGRQVAQWTNESARRLPPSRGGPCCRASRVEPLPFLCTFDRGIERRLFVQLLSHEAAGVSP